MGLKWSPLISEYFWMGTPPDHQEMDWRPPPPNENPHYWHMKPQYGYSITKFLVKRAYTAIESCDHDNQANIMSTTCINTPEYTQCTHTCTYILHNDYSNGWLCLWHSNNALFVWRADLMRGHQGTSSHKPYTCMYVRMYVLLYHTSPLIALATGWLAGHGWARGWVSRGTMYV